MSEKLKILLADDHEVIRVGLRTILERNSNWTICGEARTGRQALQDALRLRPDVIVMDISMPELNGLDAIPQILERLPDTKILILSAHESERLVRQMLSSGARGYMLKSDAGRDLAAAVQAISQGKLYFTASVSGFVLANRQQAGEAIDSVEDSASLLTPREREILQLLAEGKTNKEVAGQIGASIKTVENHRARLMTKLGFHSLTDLVRYAIQNELIRT